MISVAVQFTCFAITLIDTLIYSSKFWQLSNHGQEKVNTSQDKNFAHAVKTLFCIIKCIHHIAVANNQLHGTVKKASRPHCLTLTNSLNLRARLYHWHSILISSTAKGSRTSLKDWWHTSGCELTISNVNSLRLDWTFRVVRKSRLWQKNGHVKLKIQAEIMLKTKNVMKTTYKNRIVNSFAFDLVDDIIVTNISRRCAQKSHTAMTESL